MQTIGPLEPGEIKTARFDFSSEAVGTVTLNTPVVTVELLSGTDPTPNNVLQGSPSIVDLEVIQLIKPGVVGCSYKLVAFANDSAGNRHRIAVRVEVVPG